MKITKSMNSFIQLKKKNTFSSIRGTNKIFKITQKKNHQNSKKNICPQNSTVKCF